VNESIIVGVVVGVVVALASSYISHRLRQKERKSERRREVREGELRIICDAVDSLTEAMDRIEWSAHISPGAPAELGREAYLKTGRANVMALSLKDKELMKGCSKLIHGFNRWSDLLDADTGKAREGREKQYRELRAEMRRMASQVRRRIGQISEEV